MRILYHHRTLGDGAEGIHIREMVRAFRALGHEVKVIGPTGEIQAEASRKSKILERIKRMVPHALYRADFSRFALRRKHLLLGCQMDKNPERYSS